MQNYQGLTNLPESETNREERGLAPLPTQLLLQSDRGCSGLLPLLCRPNLPLPGPGTFCVPDKKLALPC